MHIPKKHKVEAVEKAIEEAKEHREEPQMPGVKIVVNVGAPPMPMPKHSRKPMRRKVMKAQKKEEKKGKKKNSRMAGKMEDALSGMY
jgi:transketolase